MLITIPAKIKDANIVSSNVLEDDAAAWNPTTVYGLDDLIIVSSVDVHQVWRSVHGVTGTYPSGNVGFNPSAELDLDNPVHWSYVGVTNKYRMFDNYLSSQSSRADNITFTVKDIGVVNTVGLLGCSAQTATLTGVDDTDGTFYSQTIDLVSTAGVDDWFPWFFYPVRKNSFALFENIPPYLNSTFTITLASPYENVKLGHFAAGYGYYFGNIKYGANIQNKDYSIKQQLPTGEYYFKEGMTSRIGNFEFDFENSQLDLLQNIAVDLRVTPTLIVAYADYESTLFWGLVQDMNTTLSYVSQSTCTFKLENLV